MVSFLGIFVSPKKTPSSLILYYRFPIEFLFQAFGKMKDANEDYQKNAILKFYDKNAGPERVEQIQVSLCFIEF